MLQHNILHLFYYYLLFMIPRVIHCRIAVQSLFYKIKIVQKIQTHFAVID